MTTPLSESLVAMATHLAHLGGLRTGLSPQACEDVSQFLVRSAGEVARMESALDEIVREATAREAAIREAGPSVVVLPQRRAV